MATPILRDWPTAPSAAGYVLLGLVLALDWKTHCKSFLILLKNISAFEYDIKRGVSFGSLSTGHPGY